MNAVPPKISRTRSLNGWFAGITLSVVALGLGAVIFFFNPTTHAFYPICQFHRLTGLNCPGCGATRAVYALLHGHLLTALQDNALFLFLLVLMGARVVWFMIKKTRGHLTGEIIPAKILWPLLFVAIIFTVLRNLPAFSFLSPT